MAGFNATAGSCSIRDLQGTGTDECDLSTLGDLVGGAITSKDVKFNIATDVFLDKYKEGVMARKIFPLIGLYNFEQNTPDNEIATSSIGVQFEIREGNVLLSLIYSKSHCFHKSVFSKKSFKKWNIMLFFNNHVVGAKSIDGLSWKGFDCGMFSVGTFKVQQGTDPQMTKITLQLTPEGTTEWNSRMSAISNDEVTAELNSIDGPIDVEIKTEERIAPDAETVRVTVNSSCNGAPKSGLVDSNGWFLQGSLTEPLEIRSVSEDASSPGTYILALSRPVKPDERFTIRLGDETTYVVEDILGVMYSGTSNEIVVV